MIRSSPLDYLSVFKTTTRGRWDVLTPLAILGLSVVGLFFIYSAQYSTAGAWYAEYWVRQLVFLTVGAGIYYAVSLIDYRIWLSVTHWVYLAALVLLVLVLVPGVGDIRGGAQRWLDLGIVSVQPSEPAKAAILLMVASVLIRNKVGTIRQSLEVLGKLALAVGIPMLLILLQPDLKSVIVLPPMVFSMLYVSRLSTRFFVAAFGAFLLLLAVVGLDLWRYVGYMQSQDLAFTRENSGAYEPHSFLPYLHDYQRNRILTFVAPEIIDPRGIGPAWNANQSLSSVGSGGLTGKGWTRGTQAQLGYLPPGVAHNDFIFSVIAEEKGFLGSLTVLGLFSLVLVNGIRIAGLARDRLGTLLAIGVTVLFAVHVFVNIAMTIGLVPITGIPLPFISYGGSFVLSCCLLQGLVQSVYRFRKDFT